MKKTLTTILVDDEPLARQLLREYLEDFPDIRIVGECRNGRQAVKAINELRPDLVFLDIRMPGMDGFEVLEHLTYAAAHHLLHCIRRLCSEGVRDERRRLSSQTIRPPEVLARSSEGSSRERPHRPETSTALLSFCSTRRSPASIPNASSSASEGRSLRFRYVTSCGSKPKKTIP